GDSVDCDNASIDLKANDVDWNLILEPSLAHTTSTLDYSFTLLIQNYLQQGNIDILLKLTATMVSNDENYSDMICEYEGALPKLFCELFI
ncbi:MAG: hypothetical protein PHU63_04705, partial [Candidatus ainarchaeum sp.]|nr:hypothetical protein [Candidatus ainarchaeum sp.]